MTLEEALIGIDDFSPRAWLYLPRDAEWELSMEAAVLESDEVLPEDEDLPDAGVPEFAVRRGLKQILPILVVQEVVANLRFANPSPTPTDMLVALDFYYENDAFGPH